MPRWIFALLAFCLAFAGVLVCTSESVKAALHSHGALHPWFHLVPFGVLAFLLMLSFRRPAHFMFVLLFLGALAWGTEYREHLADGWPVEQGDVALDVAGIAAGTVLGFAGRRVLPGPKPQI